MFEGAPLFKVYLTVETENDIGGRIVTETTEDFRFTGHIDLLSSEAGNDRPFTTYKAYIPNATHIIIADYKVIALFEGKGKPKIVDEFGRSFRFQYADNPVGWNITAEIYVKQEG